MKKIALFIILYMIIKLFISSIYAFKVIQIKIIRFRFLFQAILLKIGLAVIKTRALQSSEF